MSVALYLRLSHSLRKKALQNVTPLSEIKLSIWRYLNIVFVKIIGSIPRDRHVVIIINTRSQITDLSKK